MDKVYCPYCGTEMFYFERRTKGYGVMGYYLCRTCESRAPRIDNNGIDAADIKAAAYAAAIHRCIAADKQINGVCGDCMWCAESEKTNRIFCVFHGDEAEFETFADNWCSDFGRRPTDAEREEVAWG